MILGAISPELQSAAQAGGVLPVFITLRNQPDVREILARHEPPGTELLSQEAQLERRQAAFREIETIIEPEQEAVEHLLVSLGGANIKRYSAINMLAADVPASVLAAIDADPLVAEVSLVQVQTIGLPTDPSAPSGITTLVAAAAVLVVGLVVGGTTR